MRYMSRRVVAKCSKCDNPAIVEIRYTRLRLCKQHFTEFVERKVERILRRVGALRRDSVIVAAVSGGKDSSTMLAILSKLSRQYGFKLIGVHIVLGLREYSKESLEKVQQLCSRHGMPCIIVELKKLIGLSVYELARRAKRPVCSVCGLVKRYILNAVAVELSADYVALGHNTDDIVAYSIKSFINQDLEQLAKFGPATETVRDLAIGRLRPLYEVYEKESLLYALVNELPVVLNECPFRPERPIEDRIKEFMNRLEEEHPGIKLSFIRRLEKRIETYRALVREKEYRKCKYCGLVSAGEVCSFCKLTKKVSGEPLGPHVRLEIRNLVNHVLEGRSRAH